MLFTIHPKRSTKRSDPVERNQHFQPENSHDVPSAKPPFEAEELEPEEIELPANDADWDVFLPDDDSDPQPEPGDFWIDGVDDVDFCTDE
jgi:hypothetical protein